MLNVFSGLLLMLIILKANVQSARILAIVPTPSYSHQVVFRPFWKELSNRGHEVVLLTTDIMNDPSLTNLKEIDLHEAYDHWNITKITEKHKYNPLATSREMVAAMIRVITSELNHPEVQILLKNETEHFDLLIAEYLMPVMLAFSWRFKCAYIGVASLDVGDFAHGALGNPTNPAVYPDVQLPFVTPLNFWERVVSVLFKVTFKWYANYVIRDLDVQFRGYFGEDLPSMTAIMRNISMLFINSNPILHTIRPLGPNTISIGGFNHLHHPRDLPQDLQNFLDEAIKGAIYFSLGTNVKSESIDSKILKAFLGLFKTIPYKVLWKFDVNINNVPENVKIIPWGPQQDILRHKNVKLFVMQAGLQSLEEAIYYHVPMLAIPFIVDQYANAKIIERKQLGLTLDRETLTEDELVQSVLEIMQNPKYKENVGIVADIIMDRPMTGLEQAVWWTEYVLRHKGADHLKNPVRQMALYQYLLLDVIAFLLFILIVVVIVLKQIVTTILKCIGSLYNPKKLKTQ